MPQVITPMLEQEHKDLTLDPNQTTYALTELGKVREGLSILASEIYKVQQGALDTIDSSLIQNILSLAIMVSDSVATRLGAPVHNPSEEAALRKALRNANGQIARLEDKLGRKFEPSDVATAYNRLCNLVNAWWSHEGLGWAKDFSLASRGTFQVTLSCSVSSVGLCYSENPVDAEAKNVALIKRWCEAGAHLVSTRRSADGFMVDTQESREALLAAIKAALPSARVEKFVSVGMSSSELRQSKEQYPELQLSAMPCTIREVSLWIRDLEDVAALEAKPYAKNADEL